MSTKLWSNLGACALVALLLAGCVQPTKKVVAVPQLAKQEIDLGPESPKAKEQYKMGLDAMREENYEQALAVFKQFSTTFPKVAGPHVNLGIIFLRQEKFEDAEAAFGQALQLNAQHAVAHNLLGVAYREQGKFAEADKSYQKSIALDPKYDRPLLNLGILNDLYLQDLAKALDYYKRYQALQDEPDKRVEGWIVDLSRRVGQTGSPAAGG